MQLTVLRRITTTPTDLGLCSDLPILVLCLLRVTYCRQACSATPTGFQFKASNIAHSTFTVYSLTFRSRLVGYVISALRIQSSWSPSALQSIRRQQLWQFCVSKKCILSFCFIYQHAPAALPHATAATTKPQ